MPRPAEPQRPSPRWAHLEWWAPLLAACSALQRANAESGPLLAPVDVSGERARLRAAWADGPDVTVVPDADVQTGELRMLLERTAPDAEVAPVLPDHDQTFWAPSADAPVRIRYAWLLDQLSIDSTHWRMRELALVAVEADLTAESADVVLHRIDEVATIVARAPLGAGKDLIGAPDWIASRVRTTIRDGLVSQLPSRYGNPTWLVDLPR